MESFQQLYTKLTNELKELEKDIEEKRKSYDEAVKEHKEIKDNYTSLDEELYELHEERDRMIFLKDLRISVIVGILALISFLALVNLYGYLSLRFCLYLKLVFLLTDSQAILASVISMLIGILSIGFVDVIVFKKLQKYLEQKSYNKIINSDKYKELLSKIEVKEKELDKVLNEESVRRTRMSDAKIQYQSQLADISLKRELINYVERQMMSNVEKNSKPYTRRRVKENNGNIE